MLAGLTFFRSKGVPPWPRHVRFPVEGGLVASFPGFTGGTPGNEARGLAAILHFLARSEGLGHFNRSKIEGTPLPLLLLLLPAVTWTCPQTFRCTHSDQQNYVISLPRPYFSGIMLAAYADLFFCWQIRRMPTACTCSMTYCLGR